MGEEWDGARSPLDAAFAQRLPASPSRRVPRGSTDVDEDRAPTLRGGAPSSASPGTVYSDRFIPARRSTDLASGFASLAPDGTRVDGRSSQGTRWHGGLAGGVDGEDGRSEDDVEAPAIYSQVLRAELLGCQAAPADGGGGSSTPRRRAGAAAGKDGGEVGSASRMLRFSTPPGDATSASPVPFSLSPLGARGAQLLLSPRAQIRKISKVPYKILDAPGLMDDFYLSLLDWSSTNVLAVGLRNSVYLWSGLSGTVTRMAELPSDDTVASLSWAERGTHVAVGTSKGELHLWDAGSLKRTKTYVGHSNRVGSLSWTGNLLASGSRDNTIVVRDVRTWEEVLHKMAGHRQEVCGLRWSPDGRHLASGGNDNQLLVWAAARPLKPMLRYTAHVAAVKALAWSPHQARARGALLWQFSSPPPAMLLRAQTGLLASGGGTADRRIRIWNTVDDAKVCNLAWSRNVDEIVSTHGYSQNQIVVWSYPTMTQAAVLTGHTTRVLYLAVSPDGQSIVTGAGDHTLRFWTVFPPHRYAAPLSVESHACRQSVSCCNRAGQNRCVCASPPCKTVPSLACGELAVLL